MATALLIVQILLGLIFIITGSFKVFQTKAKIIESGGTWAEDFDPGIIKFIAAMELTCGLMLIASKLLALGHYLIFIGAATISLIMLGSIYVHIKRKEFKHAIINAVFLAMAIFVAYGSKPGF